MSENSKSSKVLVAILMLVILVALGLSGYKMFIYDKKEPEEKKPVEIVYDKIDYEIQENETEELLSLKNLYVKGKLVDGIEGEGISVVQYKDILLVEVADIKPPKRFYAVDSEANLIELNFLNSLDDSSYIEEYSSYKTTKDKLIIRVNRRLDEDNWYCNVEHVDDISTYNVEYKYLEGGKLGKKNVTNKSLVKDDYKNEVC